jgi:hypothetical protein
VLDTQLLIRIVGTRRKSDLTVGATANTGSESEAVAEGFVRRASHRNELLDGREFGSNGDRKRVRRKTNENEGSNPDWR